MVWSYDACGTYFLYRKYVIINQAHPELVKYAIYKESSDLSLIFQGVASTINLAKQLINELIENDTQ
jgi:hypothetical protein